MRPITYCSASIMPFPRCRDVAGKYQCRNHSYPQETGRKGEGDIERKVLHFLPVGNGKTYWFDGGNYWRVMAFIPNARTYETVNPEYSYYAGAAFGNFQAMLADIPDRLGETIPNFHNMEFRLKQLHDAVAADVAGRVGKCGISG